MFLEKLQAKLESDAELCNTIRKMIDERLEVTQLLKLNMVEGDDPPGVRWVGYEHRGFWPDAGEFVITFGADWLLEFLFTPKNGVTSVP